MAAVRVCCLCSLAILAGFALAASAARLGEQRRTAAQVGDAAKQCHGLIGCDVIDVWERRVSGSGGRGEGGRCCRASRDTCVSESACVCG